MAFARVSIASSSTSSTASRAPVSVASRSRAFHARGGVAQTRARAARAPRASGEEGDDAPPPARPNPNQMLVIVPPHPLLKHWLAVARNVQTPGPIFRAALIVRHGGEHQIASNAPAGIGL